MKKFKYLLFLFIALIAIIPLGVSAVGNDNKYELPVPQLEEKYVNEYVSAYTCKYRLNMSDVSPVYQGSFDFVINFHKLGGVTSIVVNQVSEVADWTDIDISKLAVVNSISNNVYFQINKGYYCPGLMTYVSEEQDTNTEKRIGKFTVKEYNSSEINKNPDKESINVWYPLHHYSTTYYKCGNYSNETNCKGDKYCNWVVVDRNREIYACKEIKYGTSSEPPPVDKTRTESCAGYVESIFQQNIEYSFSVDGTLQVAYSSGDLNMHGADKFVDKDGQLYKLWKNGECCLKENLGINYKQDNTILSCDGSESTWEYEISDDDDDSEDYTEGTLQSGCDIIPPVIRKWINNILNFVKYVALVLVIALGALDFIQAAGTGEPDSIKKAGQKFVKRLIAVVVLFLVPVLVDFILNMINIYGVDPNNPTCL